MASPSTIAVAGATGRLGRHVVDVLEECGHRVVAMSRTTGVDVITGDGLDEALVGVECIVDAATGASPAQEAATEFFRRSARNLHAAGARAGVRRIVAVSIIGCDRFSGGYGAAKYAHERAHLAGPLAVRLLRAAQFHEFVEQLLDWGRRDEAILVPPMRTQLVAARTVAEALADLARDPGLATRSAVAEIAGPRAEDLVEMARLAAARRGDAPPVAAWSDPGDPDRELQESGGLLPGPGATLAGPTYEEWLDLGPAERAVA
jgi:uncharacterized protein YbjT (DUF2867 family)